MTYEEIAKQYGWPQTVRARRVFELLESRDVDEVAAIMKIGKTSNLYCKYMPEMRKCWTEQMEQLL